MVHRRGHFPGFQEAKRNANEAQATRLLVSPALSAGPAELQAASAGIVFDGPSESDTNFIPPDPVIAAGPNHLVVLINSLIAIYSKAGVGQGSFQQLTSFFGSLGIVGRVYDPRVIYDQAHSRFILSAAEVDLTNFTTGRVLLAVSQTSDPTGTWSKFALGFKGRDLSNTADTFPDFPTLGLSSTAVYISTAQFVLNRGCLEGNYCSFSDTWIKVIGLPELLSGNAALQITTFKNVRAATGEPAFTIQPAVTDGSLTQEFLVAASFATNPGKKLNVFAINTAGTPTLSSVDLAVLDFWFPPDATQPGSYVGIATNDFRLLNAVWSNGSLWCAHNVGDISDYTVGGRWYEIRASSLDSVSLRQAGTIKGSGNAYYPAVAVKPNGEVGVVFSTSSRTQFPSAAFTGRSPTDAPNSMRAPAIYRDGTSAYEDLALRWGDYSGASPDPDGNSFWNIAEYARSPNPHFGTAIAQTGGPPAFKSNMARLDFGNQTVSFTSAPLTATITNLDAAPLTMGNIVIAGANSMEFALSSDGCSSVTLGPNETCDVSVTFTPTAVGTRSAALLLDTNPPSLRQVVYLSGTGVPNVGVLNLSPGSLTFPDTPVRTSSPPQTITLTNTGTADYIIRSIQTGIIYDFSNFAVSSNCSALLPASESCQVNVTFWPTHEGPSFMRLEIAGASQSYEADLVGNGITAPAATLCPTHLPFPDQRVGSTSSPQTVTINNSGSASLTISAVSLSDDFGMTNSCGSFPVTLPARTACTLNVTFTPSTLGTRTGSLTVTDNASGSPHRVMLTGTGISPPALSKPRAARALPGTNDLPSNSPASEATNNSLANAQHTYGKLPLHFEANLGQTDNEVKFIARGRGYTLFLTGEGATLTLHKPSVVSGQPSARGDWKPEDRKSKIAHQNSSFELQESAITTLSSLRTSPRSLAHNSESPAPAVLRLRLMGANPHTIATGGDELPGRSNYFRGRDPRKWRTNVPNYAQVKYTNVYPGINLVYYGNQRQLEYDFVVAPGADPGAIRLAIETGNWKLEKPKLPTPESRAPSPETVRIDRQGDLVIATQGSEVRFRKPVVYQPAVFSGQSSGATDNEQPKTDNRQLVNGRYVLRTAKRENRHSKIVHPKSEIPDPQSSEIAFELGPYDKTRPLVIDPRLEYSTYLGGSSADAASGIAVDTAGSAYVVGSTSSADFPTAQALQGAINRTYEYAGDAFVTKLSPDGSFFVFSTFFGGSANDSATGVAVDSAGNAYVTGNTSSPDLPLTPNALQRVFRTGDYGGEEAFVAKLSPDGSALEYSTYLGGTGYEENPKIAMDASGSAYVAGTTYSQDFPVTPGAFQRARGGASFSCPGGPHCLANGFVSKLSPDGSSLVYSTYLGGSRQDYVQGIAVDSSGQAYVTGYTTARDFPTTPGAFQTGHAGAPQNAFVAKLNAQGTGLVYSTYLGGDGNPEWYSAIGDQGLGIAVGTTGSVYVSGSAISVDFPATNAIPASNLDLTGNFNSDVFVTKLHPAGCALAYATLLGSYGSEWGTSIAVDFSGAAFVGGFTTSTTFPTVSPLQASFLQRNNLSTPWTAFISKLDPSGSSLVYSTFLGGSNTDMGWGGDRVNGLAADPTGNVYVVGDTVANDLPVVNAIRADYGGQTDGFVAKISPTVVPSLAISPSSYTFPQQAVGTTSEPVAVTVTNQTASAVSISSLSTGWIEFSVSSSNCVGSLAAGASCTIQVTFNPVNTGFRFDVLTIGDNAFAGPHIVALYGESYVPAGLRVYSLSLVGSTIDFGSHTVGTTSSTEVALFNTGTDPLIFSSIAVTGDFAIFNNPCGSQLPYYQSSCRFDLAFTPTAAGTRTGTLTFADNAPDSPQVISLMGTGIGSPDFSLSSGTDTFTITAGQEASSTISIRAIGNFSGTVSLTCSGAPRNAACSLAPASVIVNETTPGDAQLTVTTTARSLGLWNPLPKQVSRREDALGSWTVFLLALLFSCGLFIRSRRRRSVAVALTLLPVLFWATCGGGGGGRGGGGGGSIGTPAGIYALTVTATSGTFSHAVHLTLTVK